FIRSDLKMCSHLMYVLNDDERFVPVALHQDSNGESGICYQTHSDVNKTPLSSVVCEKNTDHSLFKDLGSLSVEHLPKSYQQEDILALIKSVADLAVVIHVPVLNQAGLYWQGTGRVEDAFIFKENTICQCKKCQLSGNPSKAWGKVQIVTSTKLPTACRYVDNIKCTLFHDDEGKTENLAYLFGDAYIFNEGGVCKFYCYTCDMDLLNKLDAYLDTFESKWTSAFVKYFETVKSAEERLLVMICHPHGCKKYVSIGKWCKLRPSVKFEAASCPGCEGSFLLIPNFDVNDDDYC
ncbi:hypothetical protein BgiMline_024734, partial [Biomphalaria glabrata]